MFYLYFNVLLNLSGVHCAVAGWPEGSGIDGSGIDLLDSLIDVDFGDGSGIGTETYGFPTLQTADFNDPTLSFFQVLDVRLCLVEILNVVETKGILSDWMMTVVESVLPGKWINISINVKINEFNDSDQSVASKNALLEISLSGKYHDSFDGGRTSEFLDQVIFDIQEAIDFVVQSGSSPSSNVKINPQCRPTFSTSNLSISSLEIQTSTTDNMITYPFEDLDKSSLSTDTVTDISTINADKIDSLSTIPNRDDLYLPTTNVYPLDEHKSASQTPKVENIEDLPISSSASPDLDNELSWETTREDGTISSIYETSTSAYFTEVDDRPSTTASTLKKDISTIISLTATIDSLDNELSWETTREDETTSAVVTTTLDNSYIFNVPTTDYYPEITLPTTESISDETLSTVSGAITYETSTHERFHTTENSLVSTIDGYEYSTEADDQQSTTAPTFSKDISTTHSFTSTTELIALTTDASTTSGSVTDRPLQTTYSPSRVYYLSEPRKLRIQTKRLLNISIPFRLWELDKSTTELPLACYNSQPSWRIFILQRCPCQLQICTDKRL